LLFAPGAVVWPALRVVPDREAARVCPKLAPGLEGAAAAPALDGVAGAVPGSAGVAPLGVAGSPAAAVRAPRC
jgi:hypothetical protein